MFYLSTPFIYVTTLLIHIIYCELEREMLFIMTTPQFIFDIFILYTTLQNLHDTGLYENRRYTYDRSPYIVFPSMTISFCCSKCGSFDHTYAIFTHIYNQFYANYTQDIRFDLLHYFYWIIKLLKIKYIHFLPRPKKPPDHQIPSYW